MRHVIAFTVSLFFHIAIVVGVVCGVNTQLPKSAAPQSKLQTVNFEFGEMIAAHAITQEPPKIDQKVIEEPIIEPEVVTVISELEPITETVSKPIPIPKLAKSEPPKKVKKTKPQKRKKPTVVKKLKKQKAVNKKNKKLTKNVLTKKRTNKLKLETFSQVDSSSGKTTSNVLKRSFSNGGNLKAKVSQSNATYRSGLVSAISHSANKYYPTSAKHRRQQGIVHVQFSLSSNGKISNISVVNSSGKSMLDKAAVKALRRLGRYKVPPAGFPTILTVPIRFRLQ